ncbi:hypothetical protein LJR034_007537 [Caballeronia sp. LjRoot34]|uniref:hypothetical protein n=1 Tax=Caballeronia sp. LjRoot34 TaxID=3342325 RepID=UPI003ECD67C8
MNKFPLNRLLAAARTKFFAAKPPTKTGQIFKRPLPTRKHPPYFAVYVGLPLPGVQPPMTCGPVTRELSANWKILVGMAGLLAEDMLSGETDDAGAMADTLFFRISNGEASTSDLRHMDITDIERCSLSYELVEEGVRLLREVWPAVQQEAEYLIASAATAHGSPARRLALFDV